MGGSPLRSHLLQMQSQDPLQKHDPGDQDCHGFGVSESDPNQDHQNSPNGGDQAAHRQPRQAPARSALLALRQSVITLSLCKSYILARSNEKTFEEFVGQVCHSGPLQPSMWEGHGSHTTQRLGNAAECSRCGARSRIVNDKVANRRLKEACPTKSQDLRRMFA